MFIIDVWYNDEYLMGPLLVVLYYIKYSFEQFTCKSVGAASQCYWDELTLLKCELMLLKSEIDTKKSANIIFGNL